MKNRSVASIITAQRQQEGAGFYVMRPFPTAHLPQIDPFLLLDHMEPKQLAPGEAKGAPDHPHRGFETVTYLLEGGMEHKDSAGNSGTLNAGDVQWMTAGSGVIHSELPSQELLKNGGKLHGFQVWVNLPGRDKMIAPRYQDTPTQAIPVVKSEDGRVTIKVIAGESLGTRAVIQTRTPILYLHVKMESAAKFKQAVPAGYNALAYVIAGELHSNSHMAGPDQLLLFGVDGDELTFETASSPADFLLLAGQPLNEPVARYGPFVMNTRSEIMQAIDDFNSGRFGSITH
jgi:redox-sensitive bicupin YhaK (pirin superfamily)